MLGDAGRLHKVVRDTERCYEVLRDTERFCEALRDAERYSRVCKLWADSAARHTLASIKFDPILLVCLS